MGNARMGEIVVSSDPEEELLALGLGSCIGLAMVDPQAPVAGLAHIVLPESNNRSAQPGRFADLAVPELLRQVMAAGAARHRLRVAMIGGASMFGTTQQLDIGARNQAAVSAALAAARITCDITEVGGSQGRTVRVAVGRGTVSCRIAGGATLELLPRQPVRRGVAA